MTMQVPSLVLPNMTAQVAAGIAIVGTETETVSNALEHTSLEFAVRHLQEKMVHVLATEVVVAGIPGPLNVWVELSPVLTTTSGAFWGAIGGGGGAIAPVTPVVEIGTGVNGTIHNFFLPWTIHSPFARVVVQTPVIVATAFWLVQVFIYGKR